MRRVAQPLSAMLILGLSIAVEALFAALAPGLVHGFAAGDIACAVVLAGCGFLIVFAVRAQAAIVLNAAARGLTLLGAPGAKRTAALAAHICPRALRATLATTLTIGIGLSGLAPVHAAETPAATTSAALMPQAARTPLAQQTARPTPPPTSPGWSGSPGSPGWPASPDPGRSRPATEEPAQEPAKRPADASTPKTSHDGPARPATARAPQGTRHAAPSHVTVRSGDTLWAIAKHHLRRQGRPAGDRDVWHCVLRIHRANAAIIGPDPDIIRPGQRLELP